MRIIGTVIGTLLATTLNLIGIFALGFGPMFFFVGMTGANDFFAKVIFSAPVWGAILFALILYFNDSLFMRLMSKYRKCREASEDEYKRLKESGALNVFEKSKAKIKKVLISDDHNVNAYAIGSETVVFNVGMLSYEEISDDMICGVAAHEAGHIFNGDTKILRMFYAFSMIAIATEAFAFVLMSIASFFMRIRIVFIQILVFPICLVIWIGQLICMILLKISHLINCGVSRNWEFAADKYAYKEGYGDGLKKTLGIFDKWEKEREKENMKNKTELEKMIPTFLKLSRNALSTHPASEKRIKALEKLDAEKNLT